MPLRPLFVPTGDPTCLKTDPAQRRAPRRRRAHGRLRRLGHAGQLRLADRRAPRGAPRRRACSTCRTCASSTSRARGARDFLRYALANNVDKLKDAGQGAVLVPAARGRRRARRPHRLLPARGFLPARRQRRHRGQGHRVAARAARASTRRSSTLTPRADLAMIAVQGPERAREGLAGAARQRGRDVGAQAVPRAFAQCGRRSSSRAPATPARTASRSCVPAARAPSAVECARRRGRRSRAASARATRCASKPA